MMQHYTFGGNTGRTYEDLQRQRYLAQSLSGPPVMPRTFGQGLSALGHALAQRVIAKNMARTQAQGREDFNAQFASLFGNGRPEQTTGGMSGGFGQPAPAPGAAGNDESGMHTIYGQPLAPMKPPNIDPRLMYLLDNPYATNGQKAIMMLMAQRALRRAEPPDPMKQLQLQEERLKLKRMQHPPRQMLTAADGYRYYTDGDKERVFPNAQRPEEPGYQMLTPEQVKQFDLPPGAYQQGPKGRISQIGGNGTNVTVNTGSPLPKPPPGYAYRLDPTGRPIVDENGIPTVAPLHDSPAEREAERQKVNQRAAERNKQTAADVVVDSAKHAMDLIGRSQFGVTGMPGSVGRMIPGTAAYTVARLIDTIKANVGFDRLQQMRAASPTGGALGPVSDMENKLLQTALGSLDQAQTEDELVHNLNRVLRVYDEIINGPRPIGANQPPGRAIQQMGRSAPTTNGASGSVPYEVYFRDVLGD